jgi:aerobic-type carbon monoxide dehydrogenase small subunit (CoxS/CutS family)
MGRPIADVLKPLVVAPGAAPRPVLEVGMISLTVNGARHELDIEPETPLLWVLRDEIGLTGTKYGCGIGQCGACTVQIAGKAVRSCSLPVGAVEGAVLTIEGLSKDGSHPVQKAWIAEDVPQCGYCQTGQIMAAIAFLKDHPKPSDAEIDAELTGICRCGTYPRLRAAIHRAAASMQG